MDDSDTRSYRPISNLSVLSKILERVVAKQMVSYLNDNSLMPEVQSAYRTHHSTETALAKVLSDILMAIDSGNIALLSLLDLSAAFDTVDHEILLRRLNQSFGLTSTVLSWLTSYLSDRKQGVRHSGSTSCATPLTCGVPQGSVLGPILFLLYTADIPKLVQQNSLHSQLYADDTQVYGTTSPDAAGILQLRHVSTGCIADIADWMKSNRLQLNSSKTEFLWCASSRRQHQLDHTPFTLGTDVVEPATLVRNLGLYLENDLSMRQHIVKLVRTSFGILRQIGPVIRTLPPDTARDLIQSFVMSRIDYCNVTLVELPKCLTDRLQSVMNASARMVCRIKKFDHVTPVLRDELHWLKITERIKFKLCLLVFKCLHDLAPKYLSQHIIPLASDPARQRLRSSKTLDVYVPRSKLVGYGDRAFCVAGPRAWNSLPASVQQADNIHSFKKLLKSHLFAHSYGTSDK